MDEAFEALYKPERNTSSLVAFFAVITVVISALGLFGLAAFAAQQRVKEISIRKVLGATVAGIVNILTKDFVKLIALAFIVSCPVAWIAMHRWLEDFAYRVKISWWIFFGAGLMAAAIAVAAIGFQAVRTAIANPVKNLRRE
jgi:putative ABC transport system permease protein